MNPWIWRQESCGQHGNPVAAISNCPECLSETGVKPTDSVETVLQLRRCIRAHCWCSGVGSRSRIGRAHKSAQGARRRQEKDNVDTEEQGRNEHLEMAVQLRTESEVL